LKGYCFYTVFQYEKNILRSDREESNKNSIFRRIGKGSFRILFAITDIRITVDASCRHGLGRILGLPSLVAYDSW